MTIVRHVLTCNVEVWCQWCYDIVNKGCCTNDLSFKFSNFYLHSGLSREQLKGKRKWVTTFESFQCRSLTNTIQHQRLF